MSSLTDLDSDSATIASNTNTAQYRSNVAIRVSMVTMIVNLVLALAKLIAGWISNSNVLIADAVHTFSDVFSTIIVIVGVKFSSKHSDDTHQYGHERFEYIASLVLAVVLVMTGLSIGYDGVLQLIGSKDFNVSNIGVLAFGATILSILSKEWMFWYTRKYALALDSGALMADAWHHRSDALSSICAIVSLVGVCYGYTVVDAVGGIVICLFILHAGVEIFQDASDKLTDASCDPELTASMRKHILSCEGVLGLHVLRTRQFGPRLLAEIEIEANGDLTLRESHTIAEKVHRSLEQKFPQLKHCSVHVNPYGDNEEEEHEDLTSA